MIQPLEFRFALTKDDYRRGVRAFYARSSTTWILFALCLALSLMNWAVFDAAPLVQAVSFVLPILFYLGFLFGFMPWWLARQVQHNERMRLETTWRVTDDRVAVSTAFAEGTMDWGTFRRVVDTPNAYLLVYTVNKNMFQIIPKRAFASPDQAAAFEQLLARKLNGPRPASA
jgi:hypothetical protein